MPTKQSCGCGFGHSRKSAFGSSADTFFNRQHNPAICLQNSGYCNATPLTRFGNKISGFGPMKIGSKKK